jgi:transcriptional regulator GlxA family with amidase domain
VEIAFLLYDELTALDIIGPYEVLGRIPEAEPRFVSKRKGEVKVDSGAFGFVTHYSLADVPRPDVFVVPGGARGTFAAAQDEEILSWVREAHEHSRYTTSVCTGSLILGAAGILKGIKATTHWSAVSFLEDHGAQWSDERIVQEGKIITAAGVSAGIDMALHLVAALAGEDRAKAAQLAIEYDPQPPFDAGSREKAGEEIVALALQELARGM